MVKVWKTNVYALKIVKLHLIQMFHGLLQMKWDLKEENYKKSIRYPRGHYQMWSVDMISEAQKDQYRVFGLVMESNIWQS